LHKKRVDKEGVGYGKIGATQGFAPARSVPTETKQKACQRTQGEKRNANENHSHLERRDRAKIW